jgi:DNA polymerase-3 subunit alpha
MFEAHDAFLCIAEGAYVDQQAPRRRLTPEHHFKSAEAMAELFSDLPEAAANTVEIARRCAFRPRKRKPILPRFAEDEVEELRRQAREGLSARLACHPPRRAGRGLPGPARVRAWRDRGHGLSRLLPDRLDFIKWAKARGIPVGPGRGSGAGSLVAYALTITDLDPLRYGLLFERFLNPSASRCRTSTSTSAWTGARR